MYTYIKRSELIRKYITVYLNNDFKFSCRLFTYVPVFKSVVKRCPTLYSVRAPLINIFPNNLSCATSEKILIFGHVNYNPQRVFWLKIFLYTYIDLLVYIVYPSKFCFRTYDILTELTCVNVEYGCGTAHLWVKSFINYFANFK